MKFTEWNSSKRLFFIILLHYANSKYAKSSTHSFVSLWMHTATAKVFRICVQKNHHQISLNVRRIKRHSEVMPQWHWQKFHMKINGIVHYPFDELNIRRKRKILKNLWKMDFTSVSNKQSKPELQMESADTLISAFLYILWLFNCCLVNMQSFHSRAQSISFGCHLNGLSVNNIKW